MATISTTSEATAAAAAITRALTYDGREINKDRLLYPDSNNGVRCSSMRQSGRLPHSNLNQEFIPRQYKGSGVGNIVRTNPTSNSNTKPIRAGSLQIPSKSTTRRKSVVPGPSKGRVYNNEAQSVFLEFGGNQVRNVMPKEPRQFNTSTNAADDAASELMTKYIPGPKGLKAVQVPLVGASSSRRNSIDSGYRHSKPHGTNPALNYRKSFIERTNSLCSRSVGNNRFKQPSNKDNAQRNMVIRKSASDISSDPSQSIPRGDTKTFDPYQSNNYTYRRVSNTHEDHESVNNLIKTAIKPSECVQVIPEKFNVVDLNDDLVKSLVNETPTKINSYADIIDDTAKMNCEKTTRINHNTPGRSNVNQSPTQSFVHKDNSAEDSETIYYDTIDHIIPSSGLDTDSEVCYGVLPDSDGTFVDRPRSVATQMFNSCPRQTRKLTSGQTVLPLKSALKSCSYQHSENPTHSFILGNDSYDSLTTASNTQYNAQLFVGDESAISKNTIIRKRITNPSATKPLHDVNRRSLQSSEKDSGSLRTQSKKASAQKNININLPVLDENMRGILFPREPTPKSSCFEKLTNRNPNLGFKSQSLRGGEDFTTKAALQDEEQLPVSFREFQSRFHDSASDLDDPYQPTADHPNLTSKLNNINSSNMPLSSSKTCRSSSKQKNFKDAKQGNRLEEQSKTDDGKAETTIGKLRSLFKRRK